MNITAGAGREHVVQKVSPHFGNVARSAVDTRPACAWSIHERHPHGAGVGGFRASAGCASRSPPHGRRKMGGPGTTSHHPPARVKIVHESPCVNCRHDADAFARWCSSRPAGHCMRERPIPQPGRMLLAPAPSAAPICVLDGRLRRSASDRARTRDRRRRRSRGRRRGSRARCAARVPWLVDVRALRLLHERTGEPVRLARFTGYQLDGGYAEHVLADARYCFALPEIRRCRSGTAPLRGLIGYRSDGGRRAPHRPVRLRRGRPHHRAGRLIQARKVAFTRPGDRSAQVSRELGATWAGGSTSRPRSCSMRR